MAFTGVRAGGAATAEMHSVLAGRRTGTDLTQLGRKVVESAVQARKCAELGPTLQQGYLHGRPGAARSIISRGSTPPRPMDAALSASVLSR